MTTTETTDPLDQTEAGIVAYSRPAAKSGTIADPFIAPSGNASN